MGPWQASSESTDVIYLAVFELGSRSKHRPLLQSGLLPRDVVFLFLSAMLMLDMVASTGPVASVARAHLFTNAIAQTGMQVPGPFTSTCNDQTQQEQGQQQQERQQHC
jgi:hypothetical protein